MKIYIDVNSQQLIRGPLDHGEAEGITQRRHNQFLMEVYFVNGAEIIEIAIPDLEFNAKVNDEDSLQRYDDNPTLFLDSFSTQIDGDNKPYWKGILEVSSGKLDKILGVDNVNAREVVAVSCVADISSSLQSTYFDVYASASTYYRVWFDVASGGVAPTAGVGGTLIEVDLATDDSAITVAAAVETAFAANPAYTVVADGAGNLLFTAIAQSPKGDASPGSSGFTVSIIAAGATAFTVADAPSVLLMGEFYFTYSSAAQATEAFDLTIQNNLRRAGAVPSVYVPGIRRGVYDIPDATSVVTVTFATPFPSASWVFLDKQVVNVTDGSPYTLVPGTLTSRSAFGFTLLLNGDTDSANYDFEYTCQQI